jgi:hypothetical protein
MKVNEPRGYELHLKESYCVIQIVDRTSEMIQIIGRVGAAMILYME